MRSFRPESLLALVALVGASGCTFVTQEDYEHKLDCLDLDNDGHPERMPEGDGPEAAAWCVEFDFPEGIADDCDDAHAERSPSNEEIPYDGWDNDCSDPSKGEDLVDVDGDKFPGISHADWLVLTEGNPTAAWPALVPTEAEVDCNDADATIFPAGKAAETWYDGIDKNCDGLDDFDQDEDGYIPTAYEDVYTGGLPAGDCDDTLPEVNPGIPASADLWYDGIDHDCKGNNDFDQDLDGYMPDKTPGGVAVPALFQAYVDKYGYSFAAQFGDCNDIRVDIYPGAFDAPYDSVDKNCLGDDDFDVDKDGYIPKEYVSIYPGTLPSGDCNDVDPTVRPGQMEIVADDKDQDCDGDIDTTTFTYSSFKWKKPRRPVLGANDMHYLLTTAADEFSDDSTRAHVGLTLPFAKTAGFGASPEKTVVWQGFITGQSDPLGWGVDMIATGKIFYAASSYRKQVPPVTGKWNDYLFLRKVPWDAGTSNYGNPLLAYHRVESDDVYEDVDLRQASNGTFWVLGCGPDTVHFVTVKDSGTTIKDDKKKAETSADGITGGDACHLQFSGGKTYALVSNGADGTLGYELVAGSEDIAPATTYDDPAFDFWSAVDRGTWQVYAGGEAYEGVTLDDGTKSYEVLGHKDSTKSGNAYTVVHADVATYGGVVYLLAIVEGATKPEDYQIVFAYGDPATGKLTDTVVKFTGAATPQVPQYAGIYADKDRVMMAVSGKAVTGTQDAVGWAFLGPKK